MAKTKTPSDQLRLRDIAQNVSTHGHPVSGAQAVETLRLAAAAALCGGHLEFEYKGETRRALPLEWAEDLRWGSEAPMIRGWDALRGEFRLYRVWYMRNVRLITSPLEGAPYQACQILGAPEVCSRR